MNSKDFIQKEYTYGAHNYKPIPVVIAKAKGAWVTDPEGKKYLDFLSAYSALNQGHLHPKIIRAVKKQLKRVTLTSRAYHSDKLAPFLEKLCKLTGYDMALPMNSGAEAVETAIKAARRWGYEIKGIEDNMAEIIVCKKNFHGRTTTIVGFSSDEGSKNHFGPYTKAFIEIPYNDLDALEKSITKNTVAILVEPIQGEAGVIVPDSGYLKGIREITKKHNVLWLDDEIQTGFGRTGKLFCYQHEDVRPDILILGKALSGGILPVSAIVADEKIMKVFDPGSHGSTFGGNPLGCVAAEAAIDVILDENLAERSVRLGDMLMNALKKAQLDIVEEVRGKGLLIAIDIKPSAGPARLYTEALKVNGLLAKETKKQTVRFAPPLVIKEKDMLKAIDIIIMVLKETSK
ncbi:MAG: ornithine--oxo-acid transaminase [Tenericutes bacterium]|nr:ornithine--oxo-acid transaminase [Mycoplasmatota bacterium]